MAKKRIKNQRNGLPNHLPHQTEINLGTDFLSKKIDVETSTNLIDSQLEYLFLQYNAVRGEVLDSFSAQRGILNTGMASIGGIVGVALGFFGNSNGSAFLIAFGFLLPFISSCFLVIWFGEIERMVRAGNYLRQREFEICNLNKKVAFGWENWQVDNKNSLNHNYIAVIILWMSVIVGAPIITTSSISSMSKTSFESNYLYFLPWWIISSILGFYIWQKSKKMNAEKGIVHTSIIANFILKDRILLFILIISGILFLLH